MRTFLFLSLSLFVAASARVELHVHLDGAVDSELLADIAALRNLTVPGTSTTPPSASDLDKLVRSKSSFERFDVINDIIGGSVEAAYAVGVWFAERQGRMNVAYSELRYDPLRMSRSSYENSTADMNVIVESLTGGLTNGAKSHGNTVHTILCAMRDQPVENCFQVAELAASLDGVVGIDLAGDEATYNNTAFVPCFKYAKEELHLNTTVHSGELGTLEARRFDIRTAVLDMNVDRIGHGYAAAGDAELMTLLKDHKVHLEVCPGTALAEKEIDAVKEFLHYDLSFGLSEDDPSPYFGGCDFECIEVVASSCQGRAGLKPSPAARAICTARRLIGRGGGGMSDADIEKSYQDAMNAAFA